MTKTPLKDQSVQKSHVAILERHVSTYNGVSPIPTGQKTVNEILDEIKNEVHKKKVEWARSVKGDKKEYTDRKKQLPSVTFGGIFSPSRKNDNIHEPSEIIAKDIDHIPNVDEVFTSLTQDEHVLFAFISPGGDGIKVGFIAEGIVNDSDHKQLYAALERYFLEKYKIQIDKSCKDISRLTYLSSDPHLYRNSEACPFPVDEWAPSSPSEKSPPPQSQVPALNQNAQSIDAGPETRAYALKILDGSCKRIRESQPGQQHETRLREARLVGGYMHHGLARLPVLMAYREAVQASGAEDIDAAMKTIRDGLEYGMQAPIEIPGAGNIPNPASGITHNDKGNAGRQDHPGLNLTDWQASNAFQGEPQARQYLIEDIFPMGQPSIVGGTGGVGKSFQLLALAVAVTGGAMYIPEQFGGKVKTFGSAVVLCGEDDRIEVHNRLKKLDGQNNEELFVAPLPSAGGAKAFFRLDPGSRQPVVTDDWHALVAQLKMIEDLVLIVIDPLQVICLLDLNLPENAQFVCSQLSALAAQTGSAVIITHHYRKTKVTDAETARDAIRGSAGLVDGVRCVYGMWAVSEKKAKEICRKLKQFYRPGCVVEGAVLKANGRANMATTTFLRNDDGVLVDISDKLGIAPGVRIHDDLVDAIRKAAEEGRPFTKTGDNGLFKRRFEMPKKLSRSTRKALEGAVDELLESQQVRQCMGPGSRIVKYLDVSDGPFAKGVGKFKEGGSSPNRASGPEIDPGE